MSPSLWEWKSALVAALLLTATSCGEPVKLEVLQTAQLPDTHAGALALGQGAIWVSIDNAILKLDNSTLKVTQQFLPGSSEELEPSILAVAVDNNGFWSSYRLSTAPDLKNDGIWAIVRSDSTGKREFRIPFPRQPLPRLVALPDAVVAGAGLEDVGELVKVSKVSGRVMDRLSLEGGVRDFAYDGAFLWVAIIKFSSRYSAILKVDPSSFDVVATIQKSFVYSVEARNGLLWAAQTIGRDKYEVERIDALSLKTTGRITIERGDMQVGDRYLWLTSFKSNQVVAVESSTLKQSTHKLGADPYALLAGEDNDAWVVAGERLVRVRAPS